MKLRSGSSLASLVILFTIYWWAESLALPPQGFPAGTSMFGNQFVTQGAVFGQEMFLQEGPIDENKYVVGPGDVFTVDVWGKARLQLRLDVDTEGKILIPDSGIIVVGDRSLADAKRIIKALVASAVPQSNVEVRLVSMRLFKVHVSGEIESPGSYIASQVTRVSEILSLASRDTLGPRLRDISSLLTIAASDTAGPGLKETSSLRNIELRHRDGEIERVDLILYFVTGDLSRNPCVRDGDVVYVPRLERFFTLGGAVMFPGTYELVKGESFSEALRLVGGVTPEADLEKGERRRFVGDERTESEYFDVGSVIAGTADFEIEAADRIYVRSPSHYLERHEVLVKGEVLFPGWYSINPREETLSQVVARAGGLTEQADLSGGRVIRPSSLASQWRGVVDCDMVKLFREKRSDKDVLLESGDIIEIPKLVSYVNVTGEVRRPGYVRFVPNKRVGYYVEQAGGYTHRAKSRKTMVIRFSTGQSLSQSEAGSVLANDLINVPAKKEGEGWEIFKDTISILAQLATVYIVVDQAIK